MSKDRLGFRIAIYNMKIPALEAAYAAFHPEQLALPTSEAERKELLSNLLALRSASFDAYNALVMVDLEYSWLSRPASPQNAIPRPALSDLLDSI